MADVIILNASPREGGNTEILCRECADAIESSGFSTEIISFKDKNFKSCTACNLCKKDKGRCAIDDDGLNEII